ncbi:MAG TPA: diaminopimelate decarboxylase [Alphaproteobacteria bacterium]|nr:diaminopimelate decarboxylase [Alphaproteobacteria bacterium]
MSTFANSPDFHYHKGRLHAESVALDAIAEAVGTPVYCYSSASMRRSYTAYAQAFDGLDAQICYAVKANGNLAVIGTFAALGAGADVVSEGEFRKALKAGVPAEKIIFSGVGKTAGELEAALSAGVTQINVESEPELEMLSAAASRVGITARVSLRINPDVDARTHEKISTGRKENKFGIDLGRVIAAYARAEALDGLVPDGLAVHIGSQLTEVEPFERAFKTVAYLVGTLRAAGHKVDRLDLGGGLGIAYDDGPAPSLADYAAVVRETVGKLDCALTFEPGRSLVGNAGVLLTRIILVKEGASRRFIIADAAMNDLKRPALYGASHIIVPVAEPARDAKTQPVDIVGPVCESGDIFAAERPLTPVEAGDLLAICSAGAYGAVMASTYNARLLVPEVLVDGACFAVVRPRQTYDEMLGQDIIPDWIDKPARHGSAPVSKAAALAVGVSRGTG